MQNVCVTEKAAMIKQEREPMGGPHAFSTVDGLSLPESDRMQRTLVMLAALHCRLPGPLTQVLGPKRTLGLQWSAIKLVLLDWASAFAPFLFGIFGLLTMLLQRRGTISRSHRRVSEQKCGFSESQGI